MELSHLVESIKNFEGVTRKKPIRSITSILQGAYNVTGKTMLGFGDDASAIDIGDDKVLLLAADGMWGKLMEADPYWAGYCSVLVNVNDIAAMGGEPLGMVNILSIANRKIGNEIMRGIRDGAEKFGVPMVGGHVHPDTPYDVLDVSIAGITTKKALITSFDAQVGDKVIVAIDLDGSQHPKFALNWDTTTHKDKELVQAQVKAMNRIAKKNLVNSGKDISNPGILGSLGMLLESSQVGAMVGLEKIPRNESVNWEDWLKLYPGSGFVLTAPSSKVDECIEILEEVNLTSQVVGEVINDKKLILYYQDQEEIVFDQSIDLIMGQ